MDSLFENWPKNKEDRELFINEFFLQKVVEHDLCFPYDIMIQYMQEQDLRWNYDLWYKQFFQTLPGFDYNLYFKEVAMQEYAKQRIKDNGIFTPEQVTPEFKSLVDSQIVLNILAVIIFNSKYSD